VVQVEGLRSFKAIAFISRKGNIRVEPKTYSEACMSLKWKTLTFPRNTVRLSEKGYVVPPTIRIGDGEWKK
jgi:hypothetical protein